MKSKILKENGLVYEVVGSKKGFETYYYLGKDPEVEQPVVEQPKPKKSKKPEIVENVENEKEPSVD